jgi:hypothetical protein
MKNFSVIVTGSFYLAAWLVQLDARRRKMLSGRPSAAGRNDFSTIAARFSYSHGPGAVSWRMTCGLA